MPASRTRRLRRPLHLSGAFALAGALFWSGWWLLSDEPVAPASVSSYTRGHEALLAAWSVEGFPFTPRLSGARAVEYSQGVRGAPSQLAFANASTQERLLAEARIEREAQADPSPRSQAAVAVRSLLRGASGPAISSLEAVHEASPEDPRILNDLAAAYLVRATREGRPEDLVVALDRARKAVALNASFVEAKFNVALALEALYLRNAAREAWEAYLAVDQSSRWSPEAREHLARLQEPLVAIERWEEAKAKLERSAEEGDGSVLTEVVRRFPREAREFGEEELLGQWGEAVLDQETGPAKRILSSAEYIGQLLAKDNREYLLLDSFRAAQRMTLKGHESLEALAAAHVTYEEARRLYVENRETEAAELFDQARETFRRFASPMADWCSFHLAVQHFRRHDLTAARDTLDVLAADSELDRYPSLLGRIFWVKGMLLLTSGRPFESLGVYSSSLQVFKRAGLRADEARVHVLLAENYYYLGDSGSAWRHIYWALAATEGSTEEERLDVTLIEAAELLERTYPDLAVLFHDEVVALAEEAQEPISLSYALTRRGDAYRKLGDGGRAAADLAEASRVVAEVHDPRQRKRVETELQRVRAELLISDNPLEAAQLLTEVASFYSAGGNHFALVPTLLSRARAQLRNMEVQRAESDLQRAIEAMEEQVETVGDPRARSSFAKNLRFLFEDMIGLQLEQGNSGLAFSYLERARALIPSTRAGARSELVQLRSRKGPIWEFPGRLPPTTTLITYGLVHERLVAWVLDENGLQVRETSLSKDLLHSRVNAFLGAISRENDEAITAIGSELFDLLIRNLISNMGPETTLALVPDGPLWQVPFAALVDRGTGRYLIEDHAILLAESVLGAAAIGAQPQPLESGHINRALVIGNPSYSAGMSSDLTELPDAEEEALRIGRILPGATVLVREQASKENFLDLVNEHRILHFATHAVLNQEFPDYSYLALTNAQAEPEPLYAQEIRSLDLDALDLVVLSACSTSVGDEQHAGSGIASAFLAAGAPSVLSTLWPVEDQATARILEEFYAVLVEGTEPERALREAQVRMLRRSIGGKATPVKQWAALQLTSRPSYSKMD